ncbi:MAG: hypothetical protein UT61_C0005G0001, partial [Candidatus Woesebacteria bacterium GW2011_GWA1_39_8]
MGVTNAFFSDTETSKDNIFQAGELDLKIDNSSYYNGVYNPGTSWLQLADLDDGENDSWICVDVTLTSDDENVLTNPEALDGDNSSGGAGAGELAERVNFIWWDDDGDNVFEICEQAGGGPAPEVACQNETLLPAGPLGNLEVGETATVALADSQNNIWDPVPSPFPGGQTKYIGKAWCFGTLATPNPVVQDNLGQVGTPGQLDSNGPDVRGAGFDCDGSGEDNQTQTDSMTADISFRAVQSRHNGGFLCNPPEVTLTPTPTGVVCIPGYATGVASSAQGLRKNGTAVLADRSDPTDALGAPQSTGTPSDTPVVFGSFFSLGFGAGNVGGGSIVLSFANPIVDLAGFDFRVFEVTGGTYPDEKIKVEASQDGVNFFLVTASATRDAFLDLGTSGLAWASQ